MAAPLLTLQDDFDARSFALHDFTAKSDKQRLNVCEDNGGQCRPCEDGT
ncbi:MAG: hypothetical protein ACREXG_05910 [Polaromonas sp.]